MIRILLFILCAQIALSDYIDSDRLIPGGWKPGIAGGIPTNYTVFCNVKVSIPGTNIVAVGDGTNDDYMAIQSALDLSTNYSVVYVPDGNYKLTNTLKIGSYCILRGAGITNTVLKTTASTYGIQSESTGVSRWIAVTNGLEKGSTNIWVDTSDSDWTPAKYNTNTVLITEQDNDTNIFENASSYQLRAIGQWNRIVEISGSKITLERPIYVTHSTNYTSYIASTSGQKYGIGIEDLTVDRVSNQGLNNIELERCSKSWIKNVKSNKCKKWHVRLLECFQCEIRDSIFYYGYGGGGDSIYGAGLYQRNTDCLIENNHFELCRHALIVEYGNQGNVFGYNCSINPINEGGTATDFLMADIITHGGTPMYNLWEGNIAAHCDLDNVLGGSRHNTVFRNWIQRKSLDTVVGGLRAVEVQANNLSNNIVGNILCYTNQTAQNYIWTNFNAAIGSVWRFNNDGNTDNVDLRVEPSTHWHFNWDYIYGSNQVAAGYTTNDVPNSLYLTEKPVWFGSYTWPPFGPDISGKTNDIPAVHLTDVVTNEPPVDWRSRANTIRANTMRVFGP